MPAATGGSTAPPAVDAGPADAGPREFIDPEDVMDAGPMQVDSAAPVLDPAYFRVTQLWLRDPRLFIGTTDITDTPYLGTSVNGTLIPGGLTMDYDLDTYADLSIVIGLDNPDPGAAMTGLKMVDAQCVLPQLTGCLEHPSPGLSASFTAVNQSTAACLEPIAGSASSFATVGGVTPSAPCFVTQEERDVVMNLGGIRLELTACTVAASYEGSGPDRLVQGLIRGFLVESSAKSILLPTYLPIGLANTPLADYLEADAKDLAQSPNGQDGWWVYLNFVAEPVTYRLR